MAQAEEGHQGSDCTASVVKGGADLEGGQSASTEVEHTLTVHIRTYAPGSPAEEGGGAVWAGSARFQSPRQDDLF